MKNNQINTWDKCLENVKINRETVEELREDKNLM